MSDINQSLPGWSYTSDAFFELEKQNLFLQNWQLVCHESNIPNPGDYFTFQIFDQRIFAIRGKDNQVRIFHNLCSHRATKLLDEYQLIVMKKLFVLTMLGVMTLREI